eukprot:8543965-Pyramimonas_sp.AAC.1
MDSSLARHPGCPMSSKAAETGVLLEFATHVLEATGGAQKYGEHFVRAGYRLVRHLNLIRARPCIVGEDACAELKTCMCAPSLL